MIKPYADLHVHTYYSDSTRSPEDVVKAARAKGLAAIAVTDHDCLDGIAPALRCSKRYSVEVIPGVELSVEAGKNEVHMLGYFIDIRSQVLRKKLKMVEESRRQRIYEIVKLLKAKGIELKPDDIFKLAPIGTIGRLHVASCMLDKGKIKSIKEAFKYIGRGGPCYVGHLKFSAKEAIDMIRSSGGVPVLAHPAVTRNDPLIDTFIEYGLKGIEAHHPDQDASETRKYIKIAVENNLIVTGGSDCHGRGKDMTSIGNVKVDYSVVDELREEAERIRNLK